MLWTPKLLWASLTNATTGSGVLLFCGFQPEYRRKKKKRNGMRVPSHKRPYIFAVLRILINGVGTPQNLKGDSLLINFCLSIPGICCCMIMNRIHKRLHFGPGCRHTLPQEVIKEQFSWIVAKQTTTTITTTKMEPLLKDPWSTSSNRFIKHTCCSCMSHGAFTPSSSLVDVRRISVKVPKLGETFVISQKLHSGAQLFARSFAQYHQCLHSKE